MVTASVVLYKTEPDMVRDLLQSLPPSVFTTIIDNSPDQRLKSAFQDVPMISYHHSGQNRGYGKGHNLALSISPPSSFHAIINPDIIVKPGAFEKLIDCLTQNADTAMVSPQMLHPDGSLQHLNRRYPTVFDLFIRRFVPQRFFRKRRFLYEMRDSGYISVCAVENVSGAFMLCRRPVLEKLGGFDPRYFMYFEDVDLGRKFHAAGYRTLYCPDAVVVHQWSRSSHRNLRLTIVHIANMIRYFNKWGWKWW